MFEIVSICKGGGYHYCRTEPPHPKRNSKGLYPLHRVIAENKVGRFLTSGEEVHHLDHDRFNNDPDNLLVLSKSDHSRLHRPNAVKVEIICPGCGNTFTMREQLFKWKQRASLRGMVTCSRACGGKRKGLHSFPMVADALLAAPSHALADVRTIEAGS